MDERIVVLWYRFGAFLKYGGKYMQGTLAKDGITPQQAVLIKVLAENKGITQNELSKRVCRDTSTLTSTLKTLLKKELVSRVQDESDKRMYHLCLTPEGIRLLQKAETAIQSFTESCAACLTEQDVVDLDRITRSLQNAFHLEEDFEHVATEEYYQDL